MKRKICAVISLILIIASLVVFAYPDISKTENQKKNNEITERFDHVADDVQDGSREEAEDIVQETFINAFRSLRQYDDSKASFATWLHRIAYHEALRRMKRRRLPTLSWDEDESLLKYAEEADTDDCL